MSASDDSLRVQAEGECADSAVSSHGGSAVRTHTRGIRSTQRVSRTTPFATRFIWQGAKELLGYSFEEEQNWKWLLRLAAARLLSSQHECRGFSPRFGKSVVNSCSGVFSPPDSNTVRITPKQANNVSKIRA